MAKYRKRKVEDGAETASVADPILVVPEDEIASVIDAVSAPSSTWHLQI